MRDSSKSHFKQFTFDLDATGASDGIINTYN